MMSFKVVLAFIVVAAANAVDFLNDGTTAAGGTGCYCGTNAAVTAATSFCNVKHAATGVVSTAAVGPACTTAQSVGSTAVATKCACGVDAIAAAATAFCFVKPSDKAGLVVAAGSMVGPACPSGESTGLVAATAKCYCGTNAVETAAAAFCNTALAATGVVSTAAVGPACTTAQSVGSTAVATKCACGVDAIAAAATAFCFVKPSDKAGLVVAAGSKVGPACVGPPTATPTATPTKAPTAAVTNATKSGGTASGGTVTHKMTQVATLGIAVAEYTGLVQQLTERAMSITLGACVGNCTAMTNGYTMSSAAKAARRAACSVTFTVGVPTEAAKTAVLTKGKAITKETLSSAIVALKAADTTYAAVLAPAVNAVVAPVTPPPSAASTTAVSMFSAFCLSMVALRQ